MSKKSVVVSILGFAILATVAVEATGVLGQLALNEALIDGARTPTGTTLISPTRVQTEDTPSVVHLSNGGQLYLGPNSGAKLAATEVGAIEIEADSGVVQLGGTQGEVMTLAYNALAVIDEEGGVEVNPDQRVCKLTSSGSNTPEACGGDPNLEGCKWDETTTGELAEGDVYYLPEEGESCEDEKGAFLPVWAWGLGGVAGVAVLAQDDTDNPPPTQFVSPFQP